MPTTFERAAAAGIAVSVISGAQFTGSGLTRAVLRGGRYVGVQALGDLAACVESALADGGFCYGYHSELDLLGHVYGPGSTAWRMQLRQVDRLVESIVEGLAARRIARRRGRPRHGGGRRGGGRGHRRCEPLMDGVEAIGGEPRARHVYVADGAADAVLAAWRETLAQRAWVVSRDEAIAAGWFGDRVGDDARFRIGDVVAAARGTGGYDAAHSRTTAVGTDRPTWFADRRRAASTAASCLRLTQVPVDLATPLASTDLRAFHKRHRKGDNALRRRPLFRRPAKER